MDKLDMVLIMSVNPGLRRAVVHSGRRSRRSRGARAHDRRIGPRHPARSGRRRQDRQHRARSAAPAPTPSWPARRSSASPTTRPSSPRCAPSWRRGFNDGRAAGVRAAIIDLDGTMLDTIPDFHVAINGMRAELGLAPMSQEQIALMVGKGSENLIRAVLALDLDPAGVEERFAAAMDAYQRHYLSINGDFSSLYPDVLAGLDALQGAGIAPGLRNQQAGRVHHAPARAEGPGRLFRGGLRRRLAAAQEARPAAAA